LGRHIRLPFATSTSRALKNFDLIHCDLWTSPVASVFGYKYCLVILDDCSHYLWTFPLRLFWHISSLTRPLNFAVPLRVFSVIMDVSSTILPLGLSSSMVLPISPQKGNAKRIIRSTNNIMRSHLFQTSLPASYWVDPATYLLNRLPTKTLASITPQHALFCQHPTYYHLRVFGCACYPNLSATAPHKLSPRSTLCLSWLFLQSQRFLVS